MEPTEIEKLREALRWCMHRLDGASLRREGCGILPDKYHEVYALAFGRPSSVKEPEDPRIPKRRLNCL